MSFDIAIYGAGGFGREVAWLVQSLEKSHNIVCFIDDNKAIQGNIFNNIRVMGLSEAWSQFPEAKIICGIGTPKVREHIVEKATEKGFKLLTVIHPNVEISEWVSIGKGAVICAGNIITTNISLGNHVQINLDCTIGHNVIMNDFATLAPGVHVSGYVHVGKRVYIGTGANIINGTDSKPLVIGDDAVIGAGSCVIRDVPPGDTVAGVPAKSIKRN